MNKKCKNRRSIFLVFGHFWRLRGRCFPISFGCRLASKISKNDSMFFNKNLRNWWFFKNIWKNIPNIFWKSSIVLWFSCRKTGVRRGAFLPLRHLVLVNWHSFDHKIHLIRNNVKSLLTRHPSLNSERLENIRQIPCYYSNSANWDSQLSARVLAVVSNDLVSCLHTK